MKLRKVKKSLEFKFLQHVRVVRTRYSFRRFRPRVSIMQFASAKPDSASAAENGLTVFTAADAAYLARFGTAFVGSLVQHVAAPKLHVHLFNPDASSIAQLQSLAETHPALTLSWTTEEFSAEPLERRSPAGRKQSWKSLYICSARFLTAKSVQDTLGTSLLIMDIDVLFNGDVAHSFSGDVDYALMPRFNEKNLCKRTLGGVVYVSSRPSGRAFLAHACKYIERFLGRKRYWFAFDQLALYQALKHMKARELLRGYKPLTAQDVSFDLAPDALILFPKGKAKGQDKFARISAQFGAPLPIARTEVKSD